MCIGNCVPRNVFVLQIVVRACFLLSPRSPSAVRLILETTPMLSLPEAMAIGEAISMGEETDVQRSMTLADGREYHRFEIHSNKERTIALWK
jgi:hypothetical protein